MNRRPRAEFSKAVKTAACAATDCTAKAIIATPLGRCCNKHYQRVRAHGSFELPKRKPLRFVVCAQCGKEFDRGYGIDVKRARRPQFCNQDCYRAYRSAEAEARLEDRFWSFVEKRCPNDCWEWKGQKGHAGYGRFQWRRDKTQLAHRISFFLANGYLPDDKFVCHACDNPSCVNPSHLWLGTQKDNMKDMIGKGRANKTPTVIGEAVSTAKMTPRKVREIRESALSNQAAATHYGLSDVQIRNIRARRHWKHVQ